MTNPVSPTFIKQEAKKIKKKLGIPLSEARNEVVKKYGYSNYMHYLNVSEAKELKDLSEKDSHFKSITLENNISKKLDLAVSYIKKFKITFKDQLDVLELFQRSQENLRILCEKLNLHDDVKSQLLSFFLMEKSQKELQTYPMKEDFVAKDVKIKNLNYRLENDKLCIEGLYELSFKFGLKFTDDVPEDFKNLPHFNPPPMIGDFIVAFNSKKEFLIADISIGEDIGGSIYMESFRPR